MFYVCYIFLLNTQYLFEFPSLFNEIYSGSITDVFHNLSHNSYPCMSRGLGLWGRQDEYIYCSAT